MIVSYRCFSTPGSLGDSHDDHPDGGGGRGDDDDDLGGGGGGGGGWVTGMSRKGGLTAARRSLFKRRKGGRSSSRDASSQPKELASYSDVASLASFAATDGTEAGQAIADNPTINSYVRVERLDCKLTFPLIQSMYLQGPTVL